MKSGNDKANRNYGRPLISLTVLTVMLAIIGSLAGCGGATPLANLGGVRNDEREQAVIANMLTLRLGVETYALKHDKKYPTREDQLKECLPNNRGDGALFNPYTNKPEWPIMGTVRSVQQAKGSAPQDLAQGVIEYSSIDDGKTYAIRGGGNNNKAIAGKEGPNTTLVLTSGEMSIPF